jgi:DnaJ-class molecular chaperone
MTLTGAMGIALRPVARVGASARGSMDVLAVEEPLEIRIDGERIDLKVPAGVQSGETLRQRGAGMSVLNGRGRGDLIVRILVETPTKLSAEQKTLLEQFRETETGDECPASKGFFARIKDKLGA